MKKIFTCLCSLMLLSAANISLKAQTVQYLHQIIVANGGVFEFGPSYNDRATIATFNPQTNSYFIFDTIEVESVQDIIIDSIYAYVAAQDSIVKYNLNTYQREAIDYFPNIKKLEIAGNYLMVGKWFGGGDYFAVYNKHNLQEIFSISQVNETVNGMVLLNDTFYVAYNLKGTIDLYPPWGVYADSIGKLAVIHASSQTFVYDIILGENAAGAGKSFVYNNSIYTICTETGYLFKYSPANGNVDSLNIGIIKYANLHNGILYGDFFTGFGAFNLNSNTFLSNPSFTNSSTYAAINYDFMNNNFYVSETDYSTYGKLYKINNSGIKTDSINVGISPEAIALDFRFNVSVNELNSEIDVLAFPNPFTNKISLTNLENAKVEVYDMNARLIYQVQNLSDSHIINSENWESGLYIIKVYTPFDVQTIKMIKR